MFGIDFYPTPPEVIERMLAGVQLDGLTILEPSAGSGNIVKFCKANGAKQVIACEISDSLQRVLSGECHIIGSDFLEIQPEQISHIDMIVMNPPFSAAEKHILHAWDIAPAGCTIISLCNATMLENRYSRQRTDIHKIIQDCGRSDNFFKCFDKAERQTGVDIGCIWLYKPGTNENEFDGYFDLYDYEQDEINGSGIVKYDFVQDIVSRYVEAVSMFNDVEEANNRINTTIKGVVESFNIKFGARMSGRNNEYTAIERSTFKKELQKAAWHRIFAMMEMNKYVTRGVMADINKFVEQQVHVPFTVKNVYLMIHMIVGTHAERMDKVIIEAFERICNFSYKDNCSGGDGWRTNTDFTINKRFILPRMTESNWSGGVGIHSTASDQMDDIVKGLCHLTGKRYEDFIDLRSWCHSPYRIIRDGKFLTGYENCASRHDDWSFTNKVKAMREKGHEVEIYKVNNQWGKWFEWNEFFNVRGYMVGTLHVEFKDEDLWARFNQKVAEIKGWTNMVTHTTKGRKAKGKK